VREEVDSLSFIWGDTYLIAIGNVPKLEKDLIGTNLRTDINSMGTNMTMIINSTVATIITPDNKQLSHSYKRWSPGI
jgi:hypothetical protein